MESIMRIKFYPACFAVAFLLLSVKGFSQQYSGAWGTLTEKPNTAIDEMINGYIEVLPPGYYDPANASKKYPLLIFLEGQSQFGNGSASELLNLYGLNEGMLPDIIRKDHFDNSYLVGSTTYQFVVIIPQIRQQVQSEIRPDPEKMASPTEINDVINYALQKYRVDVNRVYLSGLSLGGGSTWNYAGESSAYGNRVAAIIPFAGASNLWDNHSRVTNIAAANLPLWTFVVDLDHPYDTLAQRYIDSLNTHPEYTAERLITVYPAGGHNSWEHALDEYSIGATTGNATYPSLYEWMLGKSRSSLTQPVFATVNAGTDQTLNLDNGSMTLGTNSISFSGAEITLTGTATAAPGRTISSTQWVRVDGNGGVINSPGGLSTSVTGLKPGSYTYQFRVTDDQGLTTVDDVKVTVNAPAGKYIKMEAEQFTAVNPGGDYQHPMLDKTILDDGPSYGLNYLGAGHWVEYVLNGIVPGTYSLYIRYSSPYGNPGVQVVVDGTTIYNTNLTSFAYYPGPRTWHTSNNIDITLGANSTIRFISQGDEWNFNSFELGLVTAQSSLPVKFVYFNSQCKDGSAQLQWKTADEQNTHRFSVQRSTDGINWNEVGSLAAAGQANQERSYSFIDRTASTSANLYRIVEYDHTGQQIMSTIVRSNCSLNGTSVSLYPNPSSGISALNITLQQGSRVNIQVLDNRGSVLQQRGILLPAGSSSIPLDLSSYADGVYTISIQYNGERKTLKLIKN
jgi:dienelactone hydrolase